MGESASDLNIIMKGGGMCNTLVSGVFQLFQLVKDDNVDHDNDDDDFYCLFETVVDTKVKGLRLFWARVSCSHTHNSMVLASLIL